jgi:hypothetical protein
MFTVISNLEKYSNNNSSSDGTAQPNNITCNVGTAEMLRVCPDGFYVRGVKVPADDKEALTVYNAFKQFLAWAELHRS